MHDEMPQLLVSVRSAAEAAVAVANDVSIVDVKEPARGALGMAPPTTLALVARRLESANHSGSCALGELREWSNKAVPELPDSYHWCKMGFSGCGKSLDWIQRWVQVRAAIEAVSGVRKWIAVVYADWRSADAPDPQVVLGAAQDTGCAGLLLDTWSKEAPGTLSLWELSDLRALRDDCRRTGLMFALAGRLTVDQFCDIPAVAPDIVGIRSAACRGFDRSGRVEAAAIQECQTRIRSAYESVGEPDRNFAEHGLG